MASPLSMILSTRILCSVILCVCVCVGVSSVGPCFLSPFILWDGRNEWGREKGHVRLCDQRALSFHAAQRVEDNENVCCVWFHWYLPMIERAVIPGPPVMVGVH